MSLQTPHCENLWLEIEGRATNIIVGVVYRHPGRNISSFQDELHNKLLNLETNKLNYTVCGDININTLENNSKMSDHINDLNSVGCNQIINVPTRFASNCNSSLLENIYTNIVKIDTICGVCLFKLSDHLPTFITAKNINQSFKHISKYKRCMRFFILENFLIVMDASLSEIRSSSSNTSINDDVTKLTNIFKTTIDKHAPLRPMSRKEKRLSDQPWITKGTLTSIKTKNKLFKTFFKSNNPEKKAYYKRCMNKLTHIKHHAKRCYYETLIKTNNRNSSQIWSIIDEIIDRKKSKKINLPSFLLVENQMINTDSPTFLDKLCEYFANIGANMARNVPKSSNCFKLFSQSSKDSFVLQEISEEDVNSSIYKIKIASPYSSQICKIIKMCFIPCIIIKLFNKCVQQETFPDIFKIACVIPIPTVSSPKSLDHLRPISLLPVFAKIFEKILDSKMTKFLNKNGIITTSQFGFRTNSSTDLAITCFYDKLLNNSDENKITNSLFLDLKKAFDSVDHQLLLKKSYHYGFRGPVFKLLQSYLNERKICAKIKEKISKSYNINYGVPQGLVLGPLFCLLRHVLSFQICLLRHVSFAYTVFVT